MQVVDRIERHVYVAFDYRTCSSVRVIERHQIEADFLGYVLQPSPFFAAQVATCIQHADSVDDRSYTLNLGTVSAAGNAQSTFRLARSVVDYGQIPPTCACARAVYTALLQAAQKATDLFIADQVVVRYVQILVDILLARPWPFRTAIPHRGRHHFLRSVPLTVVSLKPANSPRLCCR